MISDLVTAVHSKIDPKSEAIQIAGRFRKIEGVKSIKEIIHITNTDLSLTSKTSEECAEDRKQDYTIYSAFKTIHQASTTVYAREVMKEAMTMLSFAKYIDFHGNKNHFMNDNTVFEEQVKFNYQSITNLQKAYVDSKHFKVKPSSEMYEFTDWDRAQINRYNRLKTVFETVMPVIKELYESKQKGSFIWQHQMKSLKDDYPSVFDAFDIIGLDEAKRLEFDHIKIRNAIKQKELSGQKSHFGFLRHIADSFLEGQAYSSATITNKLKTGLADSNLKLLNPGVKLLREYCELSDRITIGRNDLGNEVKGYRVIRIYNKSH